jgi:hypothetical protein
LIQLRNGSRVSEAVDAAIKFADQRSNELTSSPAFRSSS